MFETTRINDRVFSPALFLAPMAGVTNSAFRRLLADFGGYGALFTEMLVWVMSSITMTPLMPMGTLNMMTSGSSSDLNWLASTM